MTPKMLRALMAGIAWSMIALPVIAIPVTLSDGFKIADDKVGLNSEKVEYRSSGSTGVATVKYADSVSNSRTYTWPDAGADASPVMTAGNQTIAGTKTFSSPPTITGGLTSANIASGSAKRQVIRVQLSPVTGAAADSTTYAGLVSFGRAGTVKAVSFVCTVAPTVGTDTIEVLKNNSTTMLDAASYNANSLTALTVAPATLTATSADLALTATDVIRCKYNAGAQTVDAQDVTAIIEFEPTDF